MELMLTLAALLVTVLLPSFVVVGFRLHWLSLVLTMLGFLVLGFALLGLPKAVFLTPVEAVMIGLGRPALSADSVWPLTIIITLLLPLGLVPAWLVTRARRPASFTARLFVFVGVFFAVSCLIGVGRI